MEQKIKKIIESGVPLQDALGQADWDVHMHLSPLRQSLLNWYEFDPNGSLLELNAGCGALTGLFCERCRQVTALTDTEQSAAVLAARYKNAPGLRVLTRAAFETLENGEDRFDYIVAVDAVERAQDPAGLIRAWLRLLKPEGILLLTAENRYGLKYFCGAKDPYTGQPFDGVNGYIRGSCPEGKCLSRQELLSAVRGAGAENYQMFYPVPDARMPQMVFSDEYHHGLNAAERLVDYDYADPSMFGIEHRMFYDVIEQGALPFLANSFLVEIGPQRALCDIIYAVTGTDRGPSYGTATTIRKNGLVKKRPLWRQGEQNIRALCAHTDALAARGVPVVDTVLTEDAYGPVLTMPCIREQGLTPVLRRFAAEDKDRFLVIFDTISRHIRLASEPVPATGGGGETVLRTAYLDLAPCNCFYEEQTGGLLYYDQEFVMENCPAEFAIFRTLKYFYASAREVEQYIPLADMYRRYGIGAEQIGRYEAMEERFIQKVRHTDMYKQVFRWATPDYDLIRRRMDLVGQALAPRQADSEKKPYHIGYVPGVFDLFHVGHLNLLERCKARCDHLIVGVLTDELVAYYKGRGPVIPYADRARLIAALDIVDQVVPVDHSNTDKLDAWEQLHYDCHFSGDDHLTHWGPVWEELKRRGSNMEFFPYTPGISSTQLRASLERSANEPDPVPPG